MTFEPEGDVEAEVNAKEIDQNVVCWTAEVHREKRKFTRRRARARVRLAFLPDPSTSCFRYDREVNNVPRYSHIHLAFSTCRRQATVAWPIMPPWVSRKRAPSPVPVPTPPSKGARPAAKPAKPTLFDAVDAPAKRRKTVEETKKLLDELNEDDDDDDSLSEADSDDFEDVPPAKRRKTVPATTHEHDGDSDDEMDWEDAIQNDSSAQPTPGPSAVVQELEIGDVSFSLKEDGGVADQGIHIPGLGKKGPSKREKFVRIQSHCLHVQSLMWHNSIRNSWLNDVEVQRTLVDGLAEGVKREVTRWKEAMGTLSMDELVAKKKAAAVKGKGKRKIKGKGRDWHYDAEHAEQGVPNLSAGDPLLRLLKVLTAYWRKRFAVTAPGLRKQGYMAIKRLRDEVKNWEKSKGDVEEHGERIESLAHFRKLAKTYEGSRDVGAQLFAALLRGLGLDTRMVASLQPVGFGFSKTEEAFARRPKKKAGTVEKAEVMSDSDVVEVTSKKGGSVKESKAELKKKQPARKPGRGKKDTPISLDDSDSSLSSAVSDTGEAPVKDDEDDLSVIDITPSTPRRKPNKKYDRELAFPNYWVEVCSPATHKYIPVDPIVLSTIASNEDLLQTFEPRGKKAELAKQVMAYTIAFSTDGTAKDVTVRYLRKHQLPGKTKGMRMPAERVPIYNRKGKVKRYEDYDWFRTVMAGYARPHRKRTAADDLEEQTDLKPYEPEKQEKEVDKESLLWYKQSADFVLEQHLRREEALLPGSESVKSFTPAGKKGAKSTEIIPVYRREDVVACKTVESWHKEGRALREGQHPLKLVPMRAVTLIRKREMEDALRETGEKLKQGLYSREQTDWIIPPPIRDGVIPKNAFGNMDVYVPTMVPGGAVHVPLKGTAKLCRKLEIDYAEACTGFEFGKQRAVPVLTGVVVAEEHEILLREAWREEQKEIERKEDVKRTAVALQWWRKMVLGLRVLERMRVDYEGSGGGQDEVNPFVAKAKREGRKVVDVREKAEAGADDEGGGFFLPGHDEEEVPQHRKKAAVPEAGDDVDGGGGFLAESGEEDHTAGDGGYLVEELPGEVKSKASNKQTPITPISLPLSHKSSGRANGDTEDVKMGDNTTTKRALPPPGKRKVAQKAEPNRRSNPKATSESESSLSDLADEGATSSNATSDSDSEPQPSSRSKKSKPASPKVILQPQTHPRKPRVAKKLTPLKSQYFAASSAGASDEDEGESTEAEVILPRRTTARTSRRSG
ncbi:hypothetical protein LTR91_012146 [Friedmanniomyces endolithicus]|uniref:Xeroderma pigmentosum group C-complementing protein n=1 Tax=Friedmanniomyces endolithicus TaxID=329885 RepID=A0AAN6KGA6_9PEZI|nr:hypothetical protein LTR57_013067 [Friedmanniomyces endolithicus]KAK0980754.1 hypothetical protein LTR91_012146 [Friedmanniomyces endolithicus]KAK0982601.1 hypothetical protein LTS01_011335 [Friedmanniomyces endolithicus]KAK1049434.1 hypothetical protein LTS16_003711 [Friedmanniomyces endolithicus]